MKNTPLSITTYIEARVGSGFGDITNSATPETTVASLREAYKEEERRYQEYINSPEGIAAAEAEKQREIEAKRAHKEIDQKIAGIELQVIDANAYNDWRDKNQDSHDAGIFRYAERWGKLMQAEMAAGAKLQDIAKSTSYAADNEGMSGYLASAARDILEQCWVHGKALRELFENKANNLVNAPAP